MFIDYGKMNENLTSRSQIYVVKQSKRLFIFLEKYPYTFIISYMIINFLEKSSPTCLLDPTRLLISNQVSHLHVYSVLHVY